jgi:hypothetical protein
VIISVTTEQKYEQHNSPKVTTHSLGEEGGTKHISPFSRWNVNVNAIQPVSKIEGKMMNQVLLITSI